MSVADDVEDDYEADVEGDEGDAGDDLPDEGGEDGDDEGGGLSEVERLAADAGWKPRGQWKGEGWKPAEAYLRDSVKAARDARRATREMQERMDALEGTHRVTLDRQQEAIVAKAREMKAAAKTVAEVEEIEKIEREELAKLKPEGEAAPAIRLSALDKRAVANNIGWAISDEAFEDPDLAADADEAIELYTDTFNSVKAKTGDAAEAHERAGRAVQTAFPDYYEREERRPGRRPSGDNVRGFNSERGGARSAAAALPPEAMAAARDCVRRGIYGSIDEYAEVYQTEKKKGRRA